MKLLTKQKNKCTVELSLDEVILLANAINETLNALDKEEFQTRTGESVESAKRLGVQIRDLINEATSKHGRNESA